MACILTIEDDDALRSPMCAHLRSVGHSVHEASHGAVSVQKFHDAPIDLVIIDLDTRLMESLDTMQYLKRVDPRLKIIALSEETTDPHAPYLRMARELGADRVLAKPVAGPELDAAIGALVPAPQSGRTFLVLDDDATSRFLNCSILQSEFPESAVIECDTVEQALAASEGLRLDAVLTDHHLGESDGAEFVSRLRARGAGCPVLMVTGSSDPKVHARAYAAGASRVFFGSDTNFSDYLKKVLTES